MHPISAVVIQKPKLTRKLASNFCEQLRVAPQAARESRAVNEAAYAAIDKTKS